MTHKMTHKWWRRAAATCSALSVLVLAAASIVAQGKTEAERKVALTADPGSLDPYRDNSVVGVQLQGHLFDQLVDFRGPDFTQTPLVAERWENPDPTTWRFFLRKGIKFHDGKEVTAEDVKFSFELAQASPTGKAKVANVVDVKIVDRHTVEVKTSGPAASLLANLAWVFILPKADFQAKGAEAFGQKPIGSGPYRLERWDKG
jgi:peptide/nickel transport system substrate-binding protein